MIQVQAALQPALVVEEIHIDPDTPEVRIRGSRTGCLVSLLGQTADQSMTVNPMGFQMESTTPNGQGRVHIPTAHISATLLVLTRPAWMLVVGLVLLPVLIGIIFIIAYFFARRNAVVGVIADAGVSETMRLLATRDQIDELRKALDVMESLLPQSRAAGPTTPCPACGTPVPRTGGPKLTCPACRQGFPAP